MEEVEGIIKRAGWSAPASQSAIDVPAVDHQKPEIQFVT